MWRSLVVVCVVACGRGQPPGPAPAPAPGSAAAAAPLAARPTDVADAAPPAARSLPGFAEADAVAFVGGELVAWSLREAAPRRLGAVRIADLDGDGPPASLAGDWADREHLLVFAPPRAVWLVTAAAITPLALPPASAFAPPRPDVDDADALVPGSVGDDSATGLIVGAGEAWWSECPWGWPFDGFQCAGYVAAPLWPAAGPPRPGLRRPPVAARRWAWPSAAPPGAHTDEIDEGRRLACRPPRGDRAAPSALAAQGEDERVVDATWVSTAPPRLLVRWGVGGMDDLIPTRWTLHDGCAAAPVAQGEAVAPGPAGLWRGDGVVYRGTAAVGAVPGALRFRPPT